jgi:serine/threonine protein phosphatase PrpC
MRFADQHSLYAVFDGHGGVHAADMASSQLPAYIFGHDEFLSSPCAAMSQALLRFDTEYVTKAHSLVSGVRACTPFFCVVTRVVGFPSAQ